MYAVYFLAGMALGTFGIERSRPALFLRFAGTRSKILDSLDRNSYGIHVVHYGIVSYLLYAMRGADLPAMAKWMIVFPAALALSWGSVASLRRLPAVARVI